MVPLERKGRKTRYRQRTFRPAKTKESPQENTCTATVSSPPVESPPDVQDDRNSSSSDTAVGCSTPKAERFRIPEQLSCPPAPKKRKVALHCTPDKSSIRFFNPPDLETFFFFAHRNIST